MEFIATWTPFACTDGSIDAFRAVGVETIVFTAAAAPATAFPSESSEVSARATEQ
jgi:hypothetical protein